MSPDSNPRRILHILTANSDPLADLMMNHQRTMPDVIVVTADLAVSNPDYESLLTDIFGADSIQCW